MKGVKHRRLTVLALFALLAFPFARELSAASAKPPIKRVGEQSDAPEQAIVKPAQQPLPQATEVDPEFQGQRSPPSTLDSARGGKEMTFYPQQDGTYRVDEVAPGSTFEKQGYKHGDVLTSPPSTDGK